MHAFFRKRKGGKRQETDESKQAPAKTPQTPSPKKHNNLSDIPAPPAGFTEASQDPQLHTSHSHKALHGYKDGSPEAAAIGTAITTSERIPLYKQQVTRDDHHWPLRPDPFNKPLPLLRGKASDFQEELQNEPSFFDDRNYIEEEEEEEEEETVRSFSSTPELATAQAVRIERVNGVDIKFNMVSPSDSNMNLNKLKENEDSTRAGTGSSSQRASRSRTRRQERLEKNGIESKDFAEMPEESIEAPPGLNIRKVEASRTPSPRTRLPHEDVEAQPPPPRSSSRAKIDDDVRPFIDAPKGKFGTRTPAGGTPPVTSPSSSKPPLIKFARNKGKNKATSPPPPPPPPPPSTEDETTWKPYDYETVSFRPPLHDFTKHPGQQWESELLNTSRPAMAWGCVTIHR
ncbi:Hypothetical predicted protein [Lecanosticta acicola]|uniref:Uncharacterized protein n=1 Tax=Lecanosticta acicola TaxID=111012 RepID=A0AAI8Z8H0_9PEZI|nr:Hypothetical predicted protein [Lecanosticta acicola]